MNKPWRKVILIIAAVLPLVSLVITPLTAAADSLVINRVTVTEVAPVYGTLATGIDVQVSWFTNSESSGEVDYGTTTSYGSVASTDKLDTQHQLVLDGLQGNTTYHFRIIALTPSGDRTDSFDQTYTTSRYVSYNPPSIYGTQTTFVGGTYFIVTWHTNIQSDSGVDYSTNANLTSLRGAGGNGNTTAHEVVVGGLSPNTTYYFRVHSSDSNGNKTTVGGFSVTTAVTKANDQLPLLVSLVSPVSYPDSLISSDAITFTWYTNQPARGTVSVSGPNGSRVSENGFYAMDHSLTVSGLRADTVYVASIYAGDIFGNRYTTGNITLRTNPAAVLPVFTTPLQFSSEPQVTADRTCSSLYVYGVCRNISAEQKGARELLSELKTYFHYRVPAAARTRWFIWVNAYVYGGYPVSAIIQAIRFGGKTVHTTIPWEQWKTSADYLAYINR